MHVLLLIQRLRILLLDSAARMAELPDGSARHEQSIDLLEGLATALGNANRREENGDEREGTKYQSDLGSRLA